MKEYPITEETLDAIGTLRTASAVCFSMGSLTLGFTLSSFQSISLAAGAEKEIIATWSAYTFAGGIGTAACYLAGIFFYAKGGSVLSRVKNETVHDQ